MRFLLDENLPPSLLIALESRGHDVDAIGSNIPRSSPDTSVWSWAAKDNRALITLDKDFPLAELPRPPGLILLRVPTFFRSPQLISLLLSWLEEHTESDVLGRIIVLEAGRSRSREL